jgi:hypothetical protein
MADTKSQDFKNHTKLDPPFHFLMAPVALATWIWRVWVAAVHFDAENAWLAILALAFLVAVFKIRIYSLKVQDRVIRLEEQIRLQRVLPAALQARTGELSEKQLVALRFAPDAELPALVEKALANNWDNKTIKQNIVNWRPDFFRV